MYEAKEVWSKLAYCVSYVLTTEAKKHWEGMGIQVSPAHTR